VANAIDAAIREKNHHRVAETQRVVCNVAQASSLQGETIDYYAIEEESLNVTQAFLPVISEAGRIGYIVCSY
jgi:hypothetical protein